MGPVVAAHLVGSIAASSVFTVLYNRAENSKQCRDWTGCVRECTALHCLLLGTDKSVYLANNSQRLLLLQYWYGVLTHIKSSHGKVFRFPNCHLSDPKFFPDSRLFEYPGLHDGDDVVGQPVEVQSHGELDHDGDGDERQNVEDLLHQLRGVGRVHTVSVEVELEVDSGGCEEREGTERIGLGEIWKPEESAGGEGLHWGIAHPSHTKEHGGEEASLKSNGEECLARVTVVAEHVVIEGLIGKL